MRCGIKYFHETFIEQSAKNVLVNCVQFLKSERIAIIKLEKVIRLAYRMER